MNLGVLACAALWIGSCLHVPDERAARDLSIGRADAATARVVVASGLGVVRELRAGALRLWASAPELEVSLDPGEHPGVWDIRLDNVVADAMLWVNGVSIPPTLDSSVPTERHFVVTLDAKATLSLRTPDSASTQPWQFLFYADVQEAIDRVHDLYRSMNAQSAARFALIGGDLTERGSDAELERFERETKSLQIPVYSTLGNHELGHGDGAPYQQRFGLASSHFRFRGVGFSLLDSASATIAPEIYERLDGWLDDSRDQLHVVSMHVPPIDPVGVRSGSFSSKNEAQRLLVRLAEAGVDVTLYGHVHSYYAFSNAKIPAFIAGGGGAIPERFDNIGRHYLVLDVTPQTQTLRVALVRID